ncbi:MAG TPA: LLM class flavin-dependent oxidoreductase [Nocardioides sp.]|uniref:LLM class flavin-dependent oxidoreductase n=1 Tax=Nocardioides sp. TaxID=35761 RepID=UPI002E36BF1A|nr:LLM class flavin-dependent oxidoreductase [Nocardioides sp.]HEX5087804.1 LLM class flavin-dependent oxidoreductase [Nocardioides sp.]
MTRFGYTLMTEQSCSRELVRYAVAAEQKGFDFEVCSDHYSPWLTEQGHAPYAWSVLGAVAQATERVGLMTYVTCPTIRYHPAVVAQSQFVSPDDVAESIPCGPDLDKVVEAVSSFWDAGFTDVAVVQVGEEGQGRFLDEAAEPLLGRLREATP